MSIKEEMLMETLRGHEFRMNTWDYAEANSHIDPELQWILKEGIDKFTNTKIDASGKFKVFELCQCISRILTYILIEREKFVSDGVTIASATVADYMFQSYIRFTGNKDNMGQYTLADILLIYGIHAALAQIKDFKVTQNSRNKKW